MGKHAFRPVTAAILMAAIGCGLPATFTTGEVKQNSSSRSCASANDVMAMYARGRLTSAQYVELLLANAQTNANLNAFIHLDPAQVRADAAAADHRRAAGGAVGALNGLPVLIKDNIDTAAMRTTGGTPGLVANQPAADAPVVRALLDAGAIVFGKTNMHELAFGITSNNAAFGPVRNPFDLTRIPGGSSGGNGAALASCIAPVGLGTDTGGSVRIPAALTNTVGFRPTIGRYDSRGIVPISHTRDTAGPMARTLADVVLLDGVITGGPTSLAPAQLDGLRIGVPRAYYYENLDPGVAAVMELALQRLHSAGAILIEADVPNVEALTNATSFPIALFEVVEDLQAYLDSHHLGLDISSVANQAASPDVKGVLRSAIAGAIPPAVYLDAIQVQRPALQAAFQAYFDQHAVDAIIYPTTPLPAAPIGEDNTVELNGQQAPTFGTYIRNTDPESVAGIPALSLPLGFTANHLPVGIELASPSGKDRRLLSIGLAIERELGDDDDAQ